MSRILMSSFTVVGVVGVVGIIGIIGLGESAMAQETDQPETGALGPPPEVAEPYHPDADAETDITQAVATASQNGQQVLLVFGGNWCSWCRRMEHTFRNDDRVAAALAEGFQVVHVDIGERNRNLEIAERYGNPLSNGVPVIVVLDGEGNHIGTQETGSLETGDRHNPDAILAFLASIRNGIQP